MDSGLLYGSHECTRRVEGNGVQYISRSKFVSGLEAVIIARGEDLLHLYAQIAYSLERITDYGMVPDRVQGDGESKFGECGFYTLTVSRPCDAHHAMQPPGVAAGLSC